MLKRHRNLATILLAVCCFAGLAALLYFFVFSDLASDAASFIYARF